MSIRRRRQRRRRRFAVLDREPKSRDHHGECVSHHILLLSIVVPAITAHSANPAIPPISSIGFIVANEAAMQTDTARPMTRPPMPGAREPAFSRALPQAAIPAD